jgi:hypothetical protein
LDSVVIADEVASWDDTPDGARHYVLRDSDIRAYQRWLREGEPFFGDEEPLALLKLDAAEFHRIVHVEPVRWWLNGLGWAWSVEFCSPATGRTFGAMGLLDPPRRPTGIEVRKSVHDSQPEAALADLIETLGISPKTLETAVDVEASLRIARF